VRVDVMAVRISFDGDSWRRSDVLSASRRKPHT
jgi:hypothetical protein